MKNNRIQILLSDAQKAKAQRVSSKLFGKANVSGFISMLIEQYDEGIVTHHEMPPIPTRKYDWFSISHNVSPLAEVGDLKV